jgi:hypothetical protein
MATPAILRMPQLPPLGDAFLQYRNLLRAPWLCQRGRVGQRGSPVEVGHARDPAEKVRHEGILVAYREVGIARLAEETAGETALRAAVPAAILLQIVRVHNPYPAAENPLRLGWNSGFQPHIGANLRCPKAGVTDTR